MHGICQCRGEQETCTAERAGDRDGRVRRVDADVKFVRTTRARCFIPPQHTTGSRGVCSARGYHIMSSNSSSSSNSPSSSAVASWYCWYGHEVVHVGLGLGELHLVHALTGVPVEEGLAAEH